MTLSPRLTAPKTDPSYGINPPSEDASWPPIEEKLVASRNYWICTTRSDRAPHSKPVWGVWEDGLWFSTGDRAISGKNLARDPRISVHNESGDDVVILEGEVSPRPQSDVPGSVMQAYADKYAFDPRENPEPTGVWYLLVPTLAHTWVESDFQNSVARWEFD